MPALRGLCAALLGLALLALPGAAAGAEEGGDGGAALTLGIAEARASARAALQAGQAEVARAVALALLEADPRDPVALVLLAAAQLRAGEGAAGRRTAQRAYRLAGDRALRYDAARVAAHGALAEGRLTLAQLWLGQVASLAPGPAERAGAEALFRRLQAANPLRLALSVHVGPTSNVNRASRDRALIVEGIETPFVLSGDARALPGTAIGGSAAPAWRLASGPGWTAEARGRLFHTTYVLAPAARAAAPGARGEDFAQGGVEAGLRLMREAAAGGQWSFGLGVGQSWAGGAAFAASFRVEAGRTLALAPETGLRIDALAERQVRSGGDGRSARILAAQAQLFHRLGSGDVLRFRLTGVDSASENREASHRALPAELRWEPAAAIGPARLALSLSGGWRDHPVFTGGLFGAGRVERQVAGAVELLLPRAEAWGVAPVVTLRAGRSFSNVSRFEAEFPGIELALRSTF